MGKIKLNKEGLQGFFVHHVEKIVLGVIVLLLGVFVYSGYSLEGLSSDQTPDKLAQSASSAEEHVVNADNWNAISATLVVPSGHKKKLLESQDPTNAGPYAPEKPLEPVNVQAGQKREDPILFPPEKVEVVTITGPVAYQMRSLEEDLLAKEKDKTPEVKKVKPPPRRRGFDSEADSYAMEGMGAGPGYGAAGSGGGGMMPGMPGMSGMPGMPGMGGMPGEAGGMMGGYGDATGSGMMMASPADRVGFQAGQGAVARSETCVAVKAVVPWKKQWEEFEQKFSTALGYNPARDAPRYVSFTAERAEVGDDPNAELQWERITFTTKIMRDLPLAGYYGFPPEVADPRYLYPGTLTMPVPPFINRELDVMALHSEVPRLKMEQTMPSPEELAKMQEEFKKKQKEKKVSDDPNDMPGMAAMNQGAMPGMPGMGGYGAEGMGMPGMGGMPGMSMPGMGGMPGMSMPGMPGGGYGSEEMSSSMPGYGGMGEGGMMPGMSGMPGMPGMGGMPGMEGMSEYGSGMGEYGSEYGGGMGMGMMGTGAVSRGPQVSYLLIRFFDFDVEVGKKYRYRVQVLMEDPNHPLNPMMEPSERFLAEAVKQRLSPLVATEKASDPKKPNRQWALRSDFSEPSDVVEVEMESQTIAGQIAAGKFTDYAPAYAALGVDPKDMAYQTDEPTGKVMSVVWDPHFAVDVPGVIDVFRGTYLNFTTPADVIHPISLVFKTLPDYEITTDRLIADIRGGEELPSPKNDTLVAPGEYAFFDEDGRLHVLNELDDMDDLRRLTPPEVTAPSMGGYPGMGEGDGTEMMPGAGYGDEGMGGRRGRRRGGTEGG